MLNIDQVRSPWHRHSRFQVYSSSHIHEQAGERGWRDLARLGLLMRRMAFEMIL